MSNGTAESLAKEVLEGTYDPSTIEDCKADLPVDRNPNVVRFKQFALFSQPEFDLRSPNEPPFLILQQYRTVADPNLPDIEIPDFDDIADRLADGLTRDLQADELPPPEADIEDIREALGDIAPQLTASRDLTGIGELDIGSGLATWPLPGSRPPLADVNLPDPEFDEGKLRERYREWIDDLKLQEIFGRGEPLEKAGFVSPFELPGGIEGILDRWRDIFRRILLPPPYLPYRDPHPHFALCATYEQVWEPRGYTRGELLNTISLAPGEQLTLEVHSWDKSTRKSEEELATESELRVTESFTQRDVLTVAQQVGEQTNTTLGVEADVVIPKINLPLEVSGGFSSTVTENLDRTLEQTRERTVEASETLKNTRRLKVEVSREIGREQKQTRVVSNTNRCHTLNCHYFEVMSNYLVTMRLVSLEPCVLLPNPAMEITPGWVLCREGLLKKMLLDKAYLPGFEGARLLEAHAEFLELKAAEARKQAKAEVPDPLEEELAGHVDGILEAFDALRGARRRVVKAARSTKCKAAAAAGSVGLAVCVAADRNVRGIDLRRLLYLALLSTNNVAINAVKRLERDKDRKTSSSEALRSFVASASPRDFQYNIVTATVAKGLDALGVPEGLVDALLGWGLLDLVSDDAGLYNAVAAAAKKLDEVWELPPPEEPDVVREGFSTAEVAQARVAFEQLECHIEDHWLHYLQAMWDGEHHDQRFLRLQGYGSVAAVLENDVLGYLGHKAAYRITDVEAVKPWVDFADIIGEAEAELGSAEPEPRLITMPTQGTVLEAILGECNACEDFIQQSRVLELKTQAATTRQSEAEAKRQEMRLDQDPPLLDDPHRDDTPGVIRVVLEHEGGD